ncbi:MAG: ribonuclease H family protein [Lachnospiraceae bacterium]|nr:ribonuclease H family protein [Lachnospiraceae bacterium]
MAKNRYYAVKKGKKEGIFESWQECREQVEGVSGAVYKGFATREEAQCFLAGDARYAEDKADRLCGQRYAEEKADGFCGQKEGAAVDPDHLTAYVDGSYDPHTGRYAFGCIMITPSGEEIRESGSNDNEETKQLRNVAGEMLGAMYAVKWAEVNGFQSIDLYYDYEGIERWAAHEWKANTELTKKYADFMDDSARAITIRFHKVAAHTGVKYNEEADQLAKRALTQQTGIPKIKRIT